MTTLNSDRLLAAPGYLLDVLMRRPLFRKLIGVSGRIAAWNSLGCKLDSSVYIGPRVSINPNIGLVAIGRGSALTGTIVLAAWGSITIGEMVLINHDVVILTGSHDIDDPGFTGIVKPITIEDNVWIAQGAVILQGVSIGEGAVVGAYSVVSSNVVARTVVVGNPARTVRTRATFRPAVVPSDGLRGKRH